MTVYFEDFRDIVLKLEEDHSEIELYLTSLREVDYSLSEFICENRYTNIYYWQNRFLLSKMLGPELLGWVEWYLYEMSLVSDDGESNCSVNGVSYLVNDFDSFMNFARHGLCLPKKPGSETDEN